MSGANAAPGALITLDELEGLIKRLGMLGSAHDGEVLAAARFVMRWLEQHQTDWRSLLTPEEEVGVSGVVAAAEPPAVDEERSYRDGYQAGFQAAKALAQQQAFTQAAHLQSHWTGPGGLAAGLGGGLGGAGLANAGQQPLRAGAAQAGSGGLGGAPAGVQATNTWQDVAQQLLDRHAQGIPGVFRGTREISFVTDLLGRGFPTLTAAQSQWLRDIAGRSAMSW